MSTSPAPNPYLKTKVMTASPAQLRLMLFEGAIKFARQALDGLNAGDFERVFEGITRCQAIVLELINALDHQQAPELCERLSSLYMFLYTRLITASHERDPAILAEVVRLLEYERETWVLLIRQLGGTLDEDCGPSPDPDGSPGPVSLRG
jgi:flagellar protein FliS